MYIPDTCKDILTVKPVIFFQNSGFKIENLPKQI